MKREEIIANVVRNIQSDLLSGEIENLDELEVNWLESSDEYCVNYGDELLVDGLTEEEAEAIREEIEEMVYDKDILFGDDHIEMDVEYLDRKEEIHMGKKYYSDVYDITLTFDGESIQLEYSQGSGWGGAEPEAKNVLYCLVSDYWGYKNSRDFDDYCATYGVEMDDEEAVARNEKIYELVQKQAVTLERMFSKQGMENLGKIFDNY